MNPLNDESPMIMLFRDKIAEKSWYHIKICIFIQFKLGVFWLWCTDKNSIPRESLFRRLIRFFNSLSISGQKKVKNVQMESQFASKQSKLLYKLCLDEKCLKPSVMLFMTKKTQKMSINCNFADFSRTPDGTKMVRVLLLYLVIFQNQSSSIKYMVKKTFPL